MDPWGNMDPSVQICLWKKCYSPLIGFVASKVQLLGLLSCTHIAHVFLPSHW